MDDAAAALRPIDEAAASIDRLQDYGSQAELTSAIETVWQAVERSLRLRLRGDRSAPDEHRLSALSEADLPLEDVVQSLRARDRISIETAGTVHAFGSAAARARERQARPADGDTGLEAVRHLRADFTSRPDAEPAGGADAPEEEADEPRVDAASSEGVLPERRGRWMAILAASLAAFFLLALGWMLISGTGSDYEDGVSAFRAGRMDSAAVAFQRVLEDRPEDVNALLYLGRIHRRLEQPEQAADVLRRAAGVAPGDGDVRRELGHLFMDLDQPRAAVAQYERALEQEPEEMRNWAGLILALRAASDPRAEELLAEAPPQVQAMLRRPEQTEPRP